jgi:ferredoxin-nitrite reductase
LSWAIQPHTCPGLFYGTPADDGYLVRIRTPGGILNAGQGRVLAAIVTELIESDSAAIQVTNRANLQIRSSRPLAPILESPLNPPILGDFESTANSDSPQNWGDRGAKDYSCKKSILEAPAADVFERLQAVGLAAANPQVDHLRNLMASPTTGVDPQELIDARPLVQALDAYIQSQPTLAALPAKFSIGVDGGGRVGVGTRSAIAWEHRYNDIHLSAVHVTEGQAPGIYWQLALGASKKLCPTNVLIPPETAVAAIAALITTYLNFVTSHSSVGKQRMKHLLEVWGAEHYLEQAYRHLCPPLPKPWLRVNNPVELLPTQPYGHLGIHAQRQTGKSYIGVSLRLGHLSIPQLLGLADLADQFGSGQLRLTPWQTVLLPNIGNQQVAEVCQRLAELDLSVEGNRVTTAIAACVGKSGCDASATHTQNDALALADFLQQHCKLDFPVNIHFTGCPKSCAQPSPAEITLLGTIIEHSGEGELGYHIAWGRNGQSATYQMVNVPASQVPATIQSLLALYQRERATPTESFAEFSDRYPFPDLPSQLTSQAFNPPA